MPLQFKTEITPAHVRAATVGIFWRQTLQPLALALMAVLGLGLQLTLHVLVPQTSLGLHIGISLLLLGTVLGVCWMAQSHYEQQALENFKRFEGAPVQVSFDETAYHYEATWGQGEIPWSQFQSLWRLKSVWVLLQHVRGGASVLLPVESLDDEARRFLSERVASASVWPKGGA